MTQPELTVWGITARFLLGGGAVAASYVLARSLSGRWGGIFAAFPAVYLASVITVGTGVPPVEGLPLTLQVSRGALVGMAANIACAAAASMLIKPLGWKKGLAYALAVWVVCVIIIYGLVYSTGFTG